MPLGDGYSVEEQVTGEAEWGGLQISVAPLKARVWKAMRAEWEQQKTRVLMEASREIPMASCSARSASMGLAAGAECARSSTRSVQSR